ncbi:MAG: hypothetical protein WBN40_02410, partial [Pseudomonadales bacterium]
PDAAIFKTGDQWSVFVIEAGRAKMRALKIGQRNGLAVQVLEGLAEEERVIVYPDERISDGVKVRVR